MLSSPPPCQNNLRLFLDGKLVVGGRPDAVSHSSVYGGGGGGGAANEGPQQQHQVDGGGGGHPHVGGGMPSPLHRQMSDTSTETRSMEGLHAAAALPMSSEESFRLYATAALLGAGMSSSGGGGFGGGGDEGSGRGGSCFCGGGPTSALPSALAIDGGGEEQLLRMACSAILHEGVFLLPF